MYIDTHTHIYLEQFDTDRIHAVNKALEAGVRYLLMPNVDSETLPRMLDAARRYPNVCLPMFGLHPTSVKDNWQEEMARMLEHLSPGNTVAIGETGIDLYWDKTWAEEQKKALYHHAELALEHDLALVVHARKSLNEIFEGLSSFKGRGLRGVFHCFPGSEQDAVRVLDLGFMLGIGGVVTYKNSSMARVVEQVGLDHIVLETDAPYLPPVPYRGKRNESAYIPHIAQKVAEITRQSPGEVSRCTTRNALNLFSGLKKITQKLSDYE